MDQALRSPPVVAVLTLLAFCVGWVLPMNVTLFLIVLLTLLCITLTPFVIQEQREQKKIVERIESVKKM